MERDKLKLLFKISLIVFGILVFLYLLKLGGLFNFLYKYKIKQIARTSEKVFEDFVSSKVDVTRTISVDAIVQSALIQSDDQASLMDSFKHLNLYKQNFQDIRSITLFNFLYKIVLTSEVEEYIINQNLSKDWFLSALAKGYYLSEFNYDYKYNEYIITIIYSINNIIDENIGFIMIDFSLSDLYNSLEKNKDVVYIVRKNNKSIFSFPLEHKLDKNVGLNKQFPFSIERSFNNDFQLIIAADKNFFQLPGIIKIILVSVFIIIGLFIITYTLDWYIRNIKERNKTFIDMTRNIVSLSKNITMNHIQEKEKDDKVTEIDKTFLKQRKESKKIEQEPKNNVAEEESFQPTK